MVCRYYFQPFNSSAFTSVNEYKQSKRLTAASRFTPEQPSSTMNNQSKDSDLAQAAAGLLCVRKSALPPIRSPESVNNNSASDASKTTTELKPSAARNSNATTVGGPPAFAASRAAGLRSLQAVESLLKSNNCKTVPPQPNGATITPEEERAWKRARSCVYTQRNRARKAEQIALLERGIAFFRRQLEIYQDATDKQNYTMADTHKTSKLKGVKRNVYLPPEEELRQMTEEELSEWKRKERLKRKREANAVAAKQQEERIVQLAIEHEMLHDQYQIKCRERGMSEQEWFGPNC
jgi:hypothetical protein